MATPIRRNQRVRPRTVSSETDDADVEHPPVEEEAPREQVSLTALLSTAPVWTRFDIWLVGDTPLICHAWSQKARLGMLSKQTKAVKDAHDIRDPHADFVSSLYEMVEGSSLYGFPLGGVKNCICSMAHKDRGVPKTVVKTALQLRAAIVRVRPAMAGAICDMPLVRIYGSEPEMREDMVRIGTGVRKVAALAYRAQFWPWAIRITGRVNTRRLPVEALLFLTREGGVSTGLGEWRNERDGIFGGFHLGKPDEGVLWDAYAAGEGPLPDAKPFASMEMDDEEDAA